MTASFDTTIETITRSLTIPTTIGATAAIQRLRAADEAMRASSSWLKPEAVTVTWESTSAAIAGTAFGFPVTGEVDATDAAVTITLHIPWTAKALLASFGPRLEAQLGQLLA
ncbi:MAG TPA: hypothetical protein VFQ54_02640 [Thermomicrobiales bacterium]|nr:hypothetical protein [Thermomicrobiales bacterium]